VDEWQDMPAWLHGVVAGTPRAVDVYRVWEDTWKPKLAELDITPEMLEPVGDPVRPIAVSVDPPGRPWTSARFEVGGRWRLRGSRSTRPARVGTRSPSNLKPVVTMVTLGVRSGSAAFTRLVCVPLNYAVSGTVPNLRERSPLIAMQKVVGSSPIIRFS
jgi:hypothetical protein